MNQIPQRLQAVFPSISLDEVSFRRDKAYIVHQVLSQGTLADIRWLLGTYGFEEVKSVFVKNPVKVYTPAALYLSCVFLGLSIGDISAQRYDKTVPRRIG